MKEITSLNQCKIALQWFKDNNYIFLCAGGMEDGSPGFIVTFIKNDKSGQRVSIFTRDAKIEKYIMKTEPWYWYIEKK
ncbi:MAG: hypothetical protein N3I35_06800 [Clostridia bacterium]|nr:hypothetical protein [Clostridia bacterium]